MVFVEKLEENKLKNNYNNFYRHYFNTKLRLQVERNNRCLSDVKHMPKWIFICEPC
jgi:hypothetical protein